jgi:UDP-3-O-[3-hydroxymyristoyl] glucosamine N-acyltransferase
VAAVTKSSPTAAALTLGELARRVGGEVVGDGGVRLRQVATLENAGPEHIAFLANPKYRAQLATTRAGAVIVGPQAASATSIPRLVCANPYAVYAKVAGLFNPRQPSAAGVHPTAVVSPGAEVDPEAGIGPFAFVGSGARIGRGARVGAGSSVGEAASIGADTIVHARVSIYAGCKVGERCILHSGVVIGADGFGMAWEDDHWIKVPQIGAVVVGDDVEIGANSSIDRGALDDTVIEDGVRIDNQVQIGHNCRVGAHTAIAGCVGIAGSTRIGRNCRIGGAAMLSGHIDVADGTTISGGTAIIRSIDSPGIYTSVFPFLSHRDWIRNAAHLRHLDEMARQLRDLKTRLEALERNSR